MSKRLFFGILFFALLVMQAAKVYAQKVVADLSLVQLASELKRPSATIEATAENHTESLHEILNGRAPDAESYLLLIYTDLYEKAIEKREKLKKQPALGASMDPNEKAFLLQMHPNSRVSQDNDVLLHALEWQKRPLISSGKLFWCKLREPLTERGKALLDRIKKTETHFSWQAMMQKANEMKKAFEQEVDRMSQRQSNELSSIPLKKVMHMGYPVEIPDPGKQESIIRRHIKEDNDQAVREHAAWLKLWESYQPGFDKGFDATDNLMTETEYGSSLSGADMQLQALLADLQARALETIRACRQMLAPVIGNARSCVDGKEGMEKLIEQIRVVQ